MVTFQDIFTAFNGYKKEPSKKNWDGLWLLSNDCMTALIRSSFKGRGVNGDDLSGIVDGAVCAIMEQFRAARFADMPWIESRFALQRKAALKANTWATKKAAVVYSIDDVTVAVNILQKPCHPNDF